MELTGYLHPDYAKSLSQFGIPQELPQCGGWILNRQIPGLDYRDGIGCYPLFCCKDWSKLHLDLENIGTDLISLSLVTDPFGDYNEAYLCQCFDLVIPFKEHFVTDLHRPLNEIVSKNHRKRANRALKKIRIDVCYKPIQLLDEWMPLYNVLLKRYNIQGMRRFSRTTLAKQLNIPGAVLFRAMYQNSTIGAIWNYIQGDIVYGHLAAFNQLGYELAVSHALDKYTIEYFSDKARWLNLGGGSGIKTNSEDGLTQYKQGWATDLRTTYFCGRILDKKKYAEIVRLSGASNDGYFPAYRRGEFS